MFEGVGRGRRMVFSPLGFRFRARDGFGFAFGGVDAGFFGVGGAVPGAAEGGVVCC